MISLRDRCVLIIALKVKGKKLASWFCSLEVVFQLLNVGRPQRPEGRGLRESWGHCETPEPLSWTQSIQLLLHPGGQLSCFIQMPSSAATLFINWQTTALPQRCLFAVPRGPELGETETLSAWSSAVLPASLVPLVQAAGWKDSLRSFIPPPLVIPGYMFQITHSHLSIMFRFRKLSGKETNRVLRTRAFCKPCRQQADFVWVGL